MKISPWSDKIEGASNVHEARQVLHHLSFTNVKVRRYSATRSVDKSNGSSVMVLLL